MFAALLFDFDGVIVDTEVATYEAWREVFALYGAELSLDDWLPAVGTGSSTSGAFDAVAHLEQLIGATVDREAVIAARSKRKDLLYSRAPLLPGVRERLAEAQALGLKTAIVTRNREDRVEEQCVRVGLTHPWDALVCANAEPTMDKRDLYLEALARLQVRPEQALAFEDSPAGVGAAKAARVACVAVPNAITQRATWLEADLVLTSLADLSLDAILMKVGHG